MMKRVALFLLFSLIITVVVSAQSGRIVLISTNMGDMKVQLHDDTPKHRDAFIELAQKGRYNQTLFYRVIKDFMIQGGAKDSRNAPRGKRIGYGDPDKTVDDEIRPHYYHKKGVLCAPRQPDEDNPFKQSDISQFFIIQGKVFRPGELDTMQLAVNRPIRNRIVKEVYTPEKRARFRQLKEEGKLDAAREMSTQIKSDIETAYKLAEGTLLFSEEEMAAYTSVGGYPQLNGQYTIFGEVIEGLEVIDRIAALKTDQFDRPYTDVIITVKALK